MRSVLAGIFLLAAAMMALLVFIGLIIIFASPFQEFLQAEINPHQGFKFMILGLIGFYLSLILFCITQWWGADDGLKRTRPAE